MKNLHLIERSGKFFLKYRYATLVAILLLTAVFGWLATRVVLKTPTIELFPKNHEFVKTYVDYETTFGGANVCLIALEVKDGDVFNTATLTKIKDITKALELLPAVNNYQVLSLSQRKIKKTFLQEEAGGLARHRSEPVMWPDIPTTPEEIARLKRDVYTTGRLHGTMVSLDDKAALIVAGFFDRGLESPGETLRQIVERIAKSEDRNPADDVKNLETAIVGLPFTLNDTLFEAVQKITKQAEDGNTKVHMIGRPILLGYIQSRFPQLYKLFGLTVFSIIFILALYFRDLRGVTVPLATMVISAVLSLGLLGLLNWHFNPLVIVVPFVISARALSHSVQLIERYMEEYEARRDRVAAAEATYVGLFKPGVLSLVIDAASLFIVIITPIPLMERLAIMGSFWVMSIVISNVIFNPVILSIMPAPKLKEKKANWLDHLLAGIGAMVQGKARWPILGVTGVLFVIGFIFARNLVFGDMYPGSPMLWPSSPYNQDTQRIGEKFGNTESLSVILEGELKNAIKSPQVLRTMEGLQRHLEKLPEVHSTNSIADLLPEITRIMHGDNPKWELVPDDPREAGLYLEILFAGVEPGDLARFVTNDFKDANISVNMLDHKGDSLRKVVAAAKEYIAGHPMIVGAEEVDDMALVPEEAKKPDGKVEVARFRLAGNYGGLLAAINETIFMSEAKVTILAFGMVFLTVMLVYRSVLAGLLFLLPTAISNYLTYALMGALGIGLDVNTLPVVSLGVGLGVDYGLYVIGRMEEEYAISGDWGIATTRAITTAGKAVFFTATTMVLGMIFWAFSFLRFQAEMGLLLAFWMVISMLGGLILLPTIVYLIKPKFVTRFRQV
ncbi:MAG: MMPL family transporter [Myxococcales bacterium]|nr:MMPL family transporter [Myxococcales bacterium]